MIDRRPNGTTREVYVPLGNKALNGQHPRGQYQLMGTTTAQRRISQYVESV
ncbi:hypothetical protein F383_05307 [Gossypium arboreum]|uniref:Uncharacterized protein n=1 Tax=Gossypium arboreum TaxID=29729 RepID=A0A0B0PLU2_GOSAR|nr:hypothetical protein F383_05307 [Gossypium arboreum]